MRTHGSFFFINGAALTATTVSGTLTAVSSVSRLDLPFTQTKRMSEEGLYKDYTMQELLDEEKVDF